MKRISLLLVACIAVSAMCGCQNTESIVTDPDVTESTKPSATEPAEEVNPLLSESEFWEAEFTAEDAAKAFADMPKVKSGNIVNSTKYRRCKVTGDNWVIKNLEGEELICRDGVLWGSMNYYQPTEYLTTETEQKSDGHIYDGGWFYIEHSEGYEYIPADRNSAGITMIERRQRLNVDDENYLYDTEQQTMVKTEKMPVTIVSPDGSTADRPLTGYPMELLWGIVYLESGTGVDKVEIALNSATVYGEEAQFDEIIFRSPVEPQVVFTDK